MNTAIVLCTLDLYLPESHSLKDKRSTVKSIIRKLRNSFNLSISEVDKLDKWQTAVLAFVTVSNSYTYSEGVIRQAISYIEANYPQVQILAEDIEQI